MVMFYWVPFCQLTVLYFFILFPLIFLLCREGDVARTDPSRSDSTRTIIANQLMTHGYGNDRLVSPVFFFMCFMFASLSAVLTMYVLLSLIFIRCLCELAKQIGFLNSARNIFSLKDQFFTFRHVRFLFNVCLSSHLTNCKLIYSKQTWRAKTVLPVVFHCPN